MRNKLILGMAVLIIPTVIYATIDRFDEVEVRQSGETSNTVIHSAAAVGYNNYASWWSQTVGLHNFAHYNSIAAGYHSDAKNSSAAFGWYNDVNRYAASDDIKGSFAAGAYNDVNGTYSFAGGYNNDVTADRSAVLGRNLLVTENDAVIVGKYNEDKSGVVFVVGQGDATTRKNALEVHDDGSVIINQVQGDIDMGGFGN